MLICHLINGQEVDTEGDVGGISTEVGVGSKVESVVLVQLDQLGR